MWAPRLPPSPTDHEHHVLATHLGPVANARPAPPTPLRRLPSDDHSFEFRASHPDREALRTDGYVGRCSVVAPHFWWDRLANVFIILVYAPFLLFLPVLLVAGLVFVVVPGGFIVVLGGLYYAAAGVVGLLGLAARQRRQAGASRDDTNVDTPSPAGRS